jgi:hypothetical protein
MMEQQTLDQKINEAVTAQNRGIPIDWQRMCMETYNVMMVEVQRLQGELDDVDAILDAGSVDRAGRIMVDAEGEKIPVEDRVMPEQAP